MSGGKTAALVSGGNTAAPSAAWVEQPASPRRIRIALALGATLGLSAAIASIIDTRATRVMPADTVATVNDAAIAAGELERALTAVGADRRSRLGDGERQAVLDRLIDEELLIQRARDLGLDRTDRTLRSRLVGAMVEAILAERSDSEPTREQLASFYRDNAAYFAGEDRLRVREVRIDVNAARSEARAHELAGGAAARLRAGEDFAVVARELGGAPLAPLPDGLLPVSKLRALLGPSLARHALELGAGAVSDPILEGSAFHVLWVVGREAAAALPLESVASQVRAEMRRRADEQALRAYLDDLRDRARIERREP